MKKNKLIIFDWGNIVDSHTIGYNISNAFTDTFKELGADYNFVKNTIANYKLSTIRSEEEFKIVFSKMKEEYNLLGDYDNFKKVYLKYFDKLYYHKDVRDYEHSLKDKCYIAILSNLLIFDYDRINKQLDLKMYDYVFLSYEYGIRKPDREIYDIVNEKVNFDKKDILFIDDREDNILEAKNVGWNTLQTDGNHLDIIKERCESFLND